MKIIDENDEVKGAWFSQPMRHNELKLKIAHVNYMALSTTTVRARKEFKDLVFFNYVSFEDYYIWLRLLYE